MILKMSLRENIGARALKLKNKEIKLFNAFYKCQKINKVF